MEEREFFELSDYVIEKISSPFDDFSILLFEPFIVELKCQDSSLYVVQKNSSLHQQELSAFQSFIKILEEFNSNNCQFVSEIKKQPYIIEGNNVNGCKFDKIIYAIKNGIYELDFDVTRSHFEILQILLDTLNSLEQYHRYLIVHNEINCQHIVFSQTYQRWQLKESMKSFKYDQINQTYYITTDLFQLKETFLKQCNIKMIDCIFRVVQQIKTLKQLSELIAFLKQQLPQQQFQDLEQKGNSKLIGLHRNQFIRNFKVTNEFFEDHDQKKGEQKSFSLSQLLFILLIENYQTNQYLAKWIEDFETIIKQNQDKQFLKCFYEVLFRLYKYDKCKQLSSLLLAKFISSPYLNKLQFNEIFAIELQQKFDEASEKYKKLYRQTQDKNLKLLILERIAHIEENSIQYQSVGSVGTYKEILLNLIQRHGFNNINELLRIIQIISEKNEKKFFRFGSLLEIISNSSKFQIFESLLNTQNKQVQMWFIYFINKFIYSQKSNFLKINHLMRQKILGALFQLGYYDQLEDLLDLCFDNFRSLNYQEHSDIIMYQIKMLMASGYIYMAKEKVQMIISEYEGNKIQFGVVDTENCNILLALINYILKLNYENQLSKQLKEEYIENYYLVQKVNRNGKQFRTMNRNVDKLMTEVFRLVKNSEFSYFCFRSICWQQNLNKSIPYLINSLLPKLINMFGTNHLQISNLLYLISKLHLKNDRKSEGIIELKCSLIILLDHITEQQLIKLMTIYQIYQYLPLVIPNEKQVISMFQQFFLSQNWRNYLDIQIKIAKQNQFIKRFKNILKFIVHETKRTDIRQIQLTESVISDFLPNEERKEQFKKIEQLIKSQFKKEYIQNWITFHIRLK